MTITCTWSQDGDGEDAWDTSCHHRFNLNEGSPSENKMKFCCFCGGVLEEDLVEDLEIEE